MNAEAVDGVKELLLGKDPFDIERMAQAQAMDGAPGALRRIWDRFFNVAQRGVERLGKCLRVHLFCQSIQNDLG